MDFKKTFTTLFLTFITSIIYTSTSFAFFSDSLSDNDITTAIETDLFIDDGVSSHLIDVSTKDGIVTLSGSVDNILAKERSIKIVQTIRGVRSIIDKISILPVKRSDEEILKYVKYALDRDPVTEKKDISVSVENGIVTLKGKADSWQEKLIASEVTKGISGVKNINNLMHFDIDLDRADLEIRDEILARLKSDVWIFEPLVKVVVFKGNVTLKGTVGSLAEKKRAGLLAWVLGVKKVDNSGLNVNPGIDDESKRPHKIVFLTDEEIKSAIQDAFLYDTRVNPFNPKVEVENGLVTLSGVVDNLKAKKSAEKDAANTYGVWRVINKLKVRPKDMLSDSKIEEYVKDALAFHPLVDRYDIKVQVRNKKVHLNGVVDTVFDKKRVDDVVSGIKGVGEINNRLKINNSWPFKNDAEIQRNIENEFLWSLMVDGEDIFVSVANGKASLRGNIESLNELKAAVKNAFEGGARSVDAHMKFMNGSDNLFVKQQFSYKDLEVWP